MSVRVKILIPWCLVWETWDNSRSKDEVYIATTLELPEVRAAYPALHALQGRDLPSRLREGSLELLDGRDNYHNAEVKTDKYGTPLRAYLAADVVSALRPFADGQGDALTAAVAYLTHMPQDSLVVLYWY